MLRASGLHLNYCELAGCAGGTRLRPNPNSPARSGGLARPDNMRVVMKAQSIAAATDGKGTQPSPRCSCWYGGGSP